MLPHKEANPMPFDADHTAYLTDADFAELKARVAAMPRFVCEDEDELENEDDFIDLSDTAQCREHGTYS